MVAAAREIASSVLDPELPMLTLDDLGVLRDVDESDGKVVVTITPTYSGCPAMATMRDDLVRRLTEAGYETEVRVSLSPAWSSDWISQSGKAKLAAAGISPPGAAPTATFLLSLAPTRRAVTCPRCGSGETEVVSEFGSTACKAHYRCTDCLEPFDHLKEH